MKNNLNQLNCSIEEQENILDELKDISDELKDIPDELKDVQDRKKDRDAQNIFLFLFFQSNSKTLNEFNLKTLSQNIVTHVQGRIVTFYSILGYSYFY